MATPALLLVFMQPGSEVTEEEFHDWYATEHIPIRVESLPEFRTAARYKAIDGTTPKFAAMYTISDSSVFSNPAYTSLRENRSEREADIIKRLDVLDRRIYTLISDTTPLPEAIRPSSIASQIVTFNSFTPQPQGEATFNDWYEKDYIPALSKIPGWVRTRRFKLDDVALSGLSVAGEEKEKGAGIPIFLELSEFDSLSSLTNPAFPTETSSVEVFKDINAAHERRVFKLLKSYEPTAALRSGATPSVSISGFW